jgi:hypothetical protein
MFRFFVTDAAKELIVATAETPQAIFLLKLAVAVVAATALPEPLTVYATAAYPEVVAKVDPVASITFVNSLAALTKTVALASTAIFFERLAVPEVAAAATEASACSGFIKLAVEVVVATELPDPLTV